MQQQITNVLRRPFHTIPFTLTMIGLVVVSGIVSGATSGHSTAPFVARYAWSLPQIRAGHAWVIVTMIPPWADWTSNVIAMINFLIVLGVCEWLLGAHNLAGVPARPYAHNACRHACAACRHTIVRYGNLPTTGLRHG